MPPQKRECSTHGRLSVALGRYALIALIIQLICLHRNHWPTLAISPELKKK